MFWSFYYVGGTGTRIRATKTNVDLAVSLAVQTLDVNLQRVPLDVTIQLVPLEVSIK